MNKQKILKVRVDGGESMGMGHIYRCLALSMVALDYFEIIHFYIIRPTNEIIKLIEKEGIEVVSLDGSDAFFKYIKASDFIMLDGYHFSEAYELSLKTFHCKIITIDDLQHRKFHADVIINHTPGLKKEGYDVATCSKIFMGLNYALLRKEFLKVSPKKAVPRSLSKAVICFGGSDPQNFSLRYYEYLRSHSLNMDIKILIGSSFSQENSLKRGIKGDENVQLLQNLDASGVITILNESDFAITSASTISIECMKLGIPLFLVLTADNQISNFNFLIEKGCASEVEEIWSYSYAKGALMLDIQKNIFGKDVEENLKGIFEALFRF